ncbi:hypothetical protein AXFE_03830 [Acidithrix ferrooxidans]|uniref:Uncharacterized protein n=2 Tax=Acidithrix TaxID=1609233 RepID=A0A0D8HLP0_9ACTN|nr:hypothetical protein AXFE_03830 [Acidithrix ferrooxidans]
MNFKEVGNVRIIDENLALFHDQIFIGEIDTKKHTPFDRKLKNLCREGYLPMVDYHIKLSNKKELEFANAFVDLSLR